MKKEIDYVSFTNKPFNRDTAICLNGNYYDIGVPVVKWDDPKGFNSYDTSKNAYFIDDRKTGKRIKKVVKGKRYSKRRGGLAAINKIVQHHTGGLTAERAFQTLHNERRLSVQFLTDMKNGEGIIYQPLDAIECAWQAGDLNGSSIGIENVLYPDAEGNPAAYNEKRCKKLGLEPHEIGEVYIQGNTHEVFLLPEKQVEALVALTAGIWAALKYEDILADNDKFSAPLFMDGKDGYPSMDFNKKYKSHVGMLFHANSKAAKWDLAGLKDPKDFEKRVSDKFYEFVNNF